MTYALINNFVNSSESVLVRFTAAASFIDNIPVTSWTISAEK